MQLTKKISLISFLIFVFFIPFSMTWTNVFLYLSMLSTLVDKDLYKKFNFKKIDGEEKWFLIFSVFYFVWCIVSLLWSADKYRGWQLIGRYILIIAFPSFVFFLKTAKVLQDYKQIVWIFIAGVLVSSFVCLVMSYQDCWHETENGEIFNFNYYNENMTTLESFSTGFSCFTYTFLSHFIHPAYYSLYFVFTLIFIVKLFYETDNKKNKIVTMSLCVYCIIFIVLLQSRAALISLVVVILFLMLYYVIVKKRKKTAILGISIIVFSAIIIVPHTRLSGMFSGVEKALERDESKEFNVSWKENENVRILIWKSVFRIIKNNKFLGVGIGDTDSELVSEYKKDHLNFELGTHNQYLYAQISMGIVSLLLLLAMLFVPLYYGIKNRYFPLIGFSLAVIINLLFENMLTRNAGLMFIPWAMIVLLMMSEEKKKVLENDKR